MTEARTRRRARGGGGAARRADRTTLSIETLLDFVIADLEDDGTLGDYTQTNNRIFFHRVAAGDTLMEIAGALATAIGSDAALDLSGTGGPDPVPLPSDIGSTKVNRPMLEEEPDLPPIRGVPPRDPEPSSS